MRHQNNKKNKLGNKIMLAALQWKDQLDRMNSMMCTINKNMLK